MAAPTINGRNLQKSIVPRAKAHGWRVAYFPPVKTERGWRVGVAADAKGWPDLVLVRDRVVVAEIKGDRDRFRGTEQNDWLLAFRLAGVEAYVWTPSEWRDGTIEEILAR